MLDINPYLPSPPTGDCICEDNFKIPDLLYNFLTWTLSTQEENCIISEKMVESQEGLHAKILSIGPDILYLASHGKVKTPKHVSLPFLVKSETGSVEIITILNKLGHDISYSQLEEIETGIAEVQMKAVENGTLLPSNCQLNILRLLHLTIMISRKKHPQKRTPHIVLMALLSCAKQIAAKLHR